jgi:hypothetical protein
MNFSQFSAETSDVSGSEEVLESLLLNDVMRVFQVEQQRMSQPTTDTTSTADIAKFPSSY